MEVLCSNNSLFALWWTAREFPQKSPVSRHTVMCQWPRKPCDAQVCYLQEPLPRLFQPSYLYNLWADFYQIHLFYALHICDPTYQI